MNRLLAAAALLCLPIAAQAQDALIPMPNPPARVCENAAQYFIMDLHRGQVINQGAVSASQYALVPTRMFAQAKSIERLEIAEVMATRSAPGVFVLVACHARIALVRGAMIGTLVIQQGGQRWVSSWVPAQ